MLIRFDRFDTIATNFAAMSPSNAKPTTVNDLSAKLKSVRYKRWLDREYNVSSFGKYPKPSTHHRNDVSASLAYMSHYFCLGIRDFGANYQSEDARACLLNDLAHLPLDMVMRRLESEGCTLAS